MDISQQTTAELNFPPVFPNKQLSCSSQVVLGVPNRNCMGVGLCRIYMTNKAIPNVHTTVFALLTAQENGRLRISFMKTGMSERYLKEHFSWHLFQVIERFDVPGWTQRKLQLTQTTIAPGMYVVWETPEMMIVDF